MNNKKLKHYEQKYSSHMQPQLGNFEHKSKVLEQKPSTCCTVEKSDLKAPLESIKDRRRVLRDTLYEDPDLFNFSQEAKCERLQGWVKSGEDLYPFADLQIEICESQNKVQKVLNKMLEKPVQDTKAERMMTKMGWQGGALGKHGDGIIEPIAPNACYVTKTFGLGHTAKRLKSLNEKDKKDENKEYFDTNILFNILDFVKNDLQYEVSFDCSLCKRERKWVHNIVNALTNSEAGSTDFATIVQTEIAQEICKFNDYLLTTESEGVFPNRSLCLYKEAPETIYMVTPDDLKEHIVAESEVGHSKQLEEQDKETIISCTNNSAPVNIAEIKKDPNSILNDLIITVVEYFTEFVKDDNYREFRFLGPFNSEEIGAINSFVDKCKGNEFKNNDVLKDIFNNNIVEIKENCNDSAKPVKISKAERRRKQKQTLI